MEMKSRQADEWSVTHEQKPAGHMDGEDRHTWTQRWRVWEQQKVTLCRSAVCILESLCLLPWLPLCWRELHVCFFMACVCVCTGVCVCVFRRR